jgi:hypothetical protein
MNLPQLALRGPLHVLRQLLGESAVKQGLGIAIGKGAYHYGTMTV